MKKFSKFIGACLMILLSYNINAQIADNWYNLDLTNDKIFGVSTEKAYQELNKNQPKNSVKVIVAVIDAGTDISHEDLKSVLWTNEGEIPDNGIDDDKNGYIDDVHGWDFIGGKDGQVNEDTYELTRLYAKYSKKFDNVNSKDVAKEDKADYKYYLQIKNQFESRKFMTTQTYENFKKLKSAIDNRISSAASKELSITDLQGTNYKDMYDSIAVVNLIKYISSGQNISKLQSSLEEGIKYYDNEIRYHLNPNFNPRTVIGDNYDDPSQKYYGNNNVFGPNADHGTHVAGIIAADRTNNIGIMGVADNVVIMTLRVVPDGDERDKDVANAIRYAVDNGAKVINMSFGKAYPYNKSIVDEAVKYAASKDVLLVHAAGNDSKNIDKQDNFPNPYIADKKERATNWLEVGASTFFNNENLTAEFSNYGKKTVDVFAPGFEINSTVPDQKYKANSGTSMASPVTAGVAALIRSYYPELSASDVRTVIMKSVTPVKYKVLIPGTVDKKTKMKKLCKSGGVVNAYQAVQLAEKMSQQKKVAKN